MKNRADVLVNSSMGRGLLFVLVFMLTSSWLFAQEKEAKYVFIFIGDGTSFPQRNAAEYYLASLNAPKDLETLIGRAEKKISVSQGISDFKPATQRLLMNRFPTQGLSTTYSTNSLITDSSSSGTAIATGTKTKDGVLGMDSAAKEKLVSMAKMAKAKGKKVGIVSTVSLDHATPGAFYASAPHRNMYYEIASQIPDSGFEYFAGGGFLARKTPKNNDMEISELIKSKGYRVINTREDFDKLAKGDEKVVANNPVLDADQALPYSIDMTEGEISLAEFVAKGIELLDNDQGFFMMAEAGKIDWACHANDAISAIRDVIALDAAVKVAYDFYLKHPDETLILVTGDHETGGMAVGFAGTRYDAFLTKIHGQKGSYLAFNKKVNEIRTANPNATLADFLPVIEDFFGLKYYFPEEMALLKKSAEAGDSKAVEEMGMALRDYEVQNLERAVAMTMVPANNRPRSEDIYYLSYGDYEPLTVTLTHILNNKAGIGWTTYSHSGLPTPVSVIGVGHENFVGHYDNTDIFKRVVSIAKY